jgi:hypothetical protein
MTIYKTIDALPAAAVASATDLLEISQSGTSRQVTVGQVAATHSNSVLNYGVRGDGSNETATIQAAVDATPAGAALLFPPTTACYLVSKLVISKSIYLVGGGDSSILRQTPNNGQQLIEITANGVHFPCRGMMLDQNCRIRREPPAFHLRQSVQSPMS